MKFMTALNKVKEGRIIKFNGGWLEPYDDYFFLQAVVDYRGNVTKIFHKYTFYQEHGFKTVKKGKM